MLWPQNWIKLKLTMLVYSNYHAANSIASPSRLVCLDLRVSKVVWFSNEIRLKGKIFEVMGFGWPCFVFIRYLRLYCMKVIWKH